MKQISKYFRQYHSKPTDDHVDARLNEFLQKNPNYTVHKVCFQYYANNCVENLFVVFNIEEEEDYTK